MVVVVDKSGSFCATGSIVSDRPYNSRKRDDYGIFYVGSCWILNYRPTEGQAYNEHNVLVYAES